MSTQHQLEDTLGILLPEEMIEKFGLKEGDVFELVSTDRGMVLHPLSDTLAAQIDAAELDQKKFKVIVQDLAKLPSF